MRIRTGCVAAALITCGVVLSAQGAGPPAPSTKIFLAPFREGEDKTTRIAILVIQKRGTAVGKPVNITKSPGDDDLPCFLPDSGSVVFVSSRDGRPGATYQYDIATKTIAPTEAGRQCAPVAPPATPAVEGSEPSASTPGGSMIKWRQSKLLLRKAGEDEWIELADLSKAGVANITRVVVSPDAKWIAIVATPSVK